MRALRVTFLSCWLCSTAIHARAQEPAPQTRTETIEAERDQKAETLAPDQPTAWERRLIAIKDRKIFERLSYGVAGLRLGVGQTGTGGGFSVGPDYLREDIARGEIRIHAGAYASTRRWTKLLTEFDAPSFAGNRLFFHAAAVHHNYNSVPFYGPGPDSEKTARSNYRYESLATDAWLGVKASKFLRYGGSMGHLRANTGTGADRRFASAEAQFPGTTGIADQSSFLRWGGFAHFDYRDSALGPRAGGSYLFQYDLFSDRDLRLHSFRRLDAELQQYFPLFNKRRVIALRARTALTYARAGNTVPFYLQSVIGGSDDLRGFRPYRFYDDNMLVMNAEYRWEIFSGLDGAVFADAGKVFSRRAELNFRNLESAVGFGLRFNIRNSPFLRLDTGFSHEGFQVWLKFSGIFQQRPYAVSHGSFIE